MAGALLAVVVRKGEDELVQLEALFSLSDAGRAELIATVEPGLSRFLRRELEAYEDPFV